MKARISYSTTKSFDKDFKRLAKKFRTLGSDIEVVKTNTIELYHLQKIDNRSIFPMQAYCFEDVKVYKIKKIACWSLKGKGNRSGLRIIYAFFPETLSVVFIEIYYKKKNNTVANRERIKEFVRERSSCFN